MSNVVLIVVAAVVVLGIVLLAAALKIVKHYERGVLVRLGRLHGTRQPGLNVVIPVADVRRPPTSSWRTPWHCIAARATSPPAQGSEGAPATADEDSPGG